MFKQNKYYRKIWSQVSGGQIQKVSKGWDAIINNVVNRGLANKVRSEPKDLQEVMEAARGI